jgi:hypothetical protein|nr:MAG TPA: chromatin structure-remodeling complex protein [Caudoviricetes sp.]
MKELKTITEYQLLRLVDDSLFKRIVHEKNILKMYNEQLAEVRERILEMENNNAE